MTPRAYVPHQLLVHVDEHPNGEVEVRYDYPFSEPHPPPEQVIRLPADTVPEQLRADLSAFRALLRGRLELQPVRIPHGQVTPTFRDGILTVVTRDQRRVLPIARLYVDEIAEQLGSRRERQSRMEGTDFAADQRDIWTIIAQTVNGLAWKDFQARLTRPL
jgi:hypothetical protein